MPQVPQLNPSVDGSTHAPLHAVRFVAQLSLQAPPLHTLPAGQRLPQAPQFAGSEPGSMHCPLHIERPVEHTQPPLEQVAPEGHTVPQPPQFRVSVNTSTQAPPHAVRPSEQLTAQRPASHTSVDEHPTPQPPQWFGSLASSTHSAPHGVRPPAHEQTPCTQLAPVGQTLPQAPQSSGSEKRSTQAPKQLKSSGSQPAAHVPELHTSSTPQVTSQSPQ
jgi:hypothetical protein